MFVCFDSLSFSSSLLSYSPPNFHGSLLILFVYKKRLKYFIALQVSEMCRIVGYHLPVTALKHNALIRRKFSNVDSDELKHLTFERRL